MSLPPSSGNRSGLEKVAAEKNATTSKSSAGRSPLWAILRTSLISKVVSRLAGPFVDSQILSVVHEYFPKARVISHNRHDILHIETRLSHVTAKFAHVTFSVILKDPQIDELCQAMELSGYRALIFGFTSSKVVWFLRAADFYILDEEEWFNYRLCLDNTAIKSILVPDVPVVAPVE
jgi:hypothetical protein